MLDKLERYLFYIFLFSIPLQTRKIFYYPGWRYNEWLSMSVYLSDIILCLLLIVAIYLWAKNNYRFYPKIDKPSYVLFGLVVIGALSIFKSLDRGVAIFQLIKLIEFIGLYFYIKNYATSRFNFSRGLVAIVAGGLLQSIIAIAQFLKQGDLGLRYLGESPLGLYMNGVAIFTNTVGERIIRAYGTTPHPNVLAIFLFLAIYCLYNYWSYRDTAKNGMNYILFTIHSILLLGLLLTFSRTIIFFWALGFVLRGGLLAFKTNFRELFWAKSENKIKLKLILASTLLVILMVSVLYWSSVLSRITMSYEEEAVQMRLFYAEESLSSDIKIVGYGLGNFVPWLMYESPHLPSYYYQPVHNIYLLAYNEVGLIGCILFIAFLVLIIGEYVLDTRFKKMYHYSFIILFGSLLLIGLFDHFFWTLQQGRLVFWLVAGLISSKKLIMG